MILCTYNILDGGMGRTDPLAEVIRLSGADMAVLQECTDESLLARLAGRLGMEFFRAPNPANAEAAVALLYDPGKYELREAVNWAPLDRRLTRSALHAVLREKAGGGGSSAEPVEWAIVGLHLHARETLADEQVRLSELPAVLEIGERLRQAGREVILCGDFNTSHPEQVIDPAKLRPKVRERIAPQGGILPREVIGRVLEAGWIDAHAIGRRPEQFQVSFTTSAPAMRVDYILVTPGLVKQVKSCDVMYPEIARYASDHFPVVAELTN